MNADGPKTHKTVCSQINCHTHVTWQRSRQKSDDKNLSKDSMSDLFTIAGMLFNSLEMTRQNSERGKNAKNSEIFCTKNRRKTAKNS
jgi:imidazolonepropionase-like amidohydrolase